MNRTHESGRSNRDKLISTVTVAGIGITALTSCAADQEPEAPIQTEVESTFVTEIPITPSPIETETETPTPLPIQTAESNPVNIPSPSTSESLTNSSEYALKAERYGITTEEYEALVKSYEITSSDISTPEDMAVKVAEKITFFYSGGLNESDLNTYSKWKDPAGEIESGWNNWSTNLHAEAFQDAFGTPEGFETLKENKRILAGLWGLSVMEGDPGYFMKVTYELNSWTPYKTPTGEEGLGIVGTYSSAGNATDNPSLQGNNKLPEDSVVPNTKVDVSKDGDVWRLNSII